MSNTPRSGRREIGRKPFVDLTNAPSRRRSTSKSSDPIRRYPEEPPPPPPPPSTPGPGPGPRSSAARSRSLLASVASREPGVAETSSQGSVPNGKEKGKSVPNGKENGKQVAVSLALSCPPPRRLRRRSRENSELEGEEINCLKVCSAPNPQHKKKTRRTTTISREQEEAELKDFYEKMNTYFAEIDAYELLVESASDTDSD